MAELGLSIINRYFNTGDWYIKQKYHEGDKLSKEQLIALFKEAYEYALQECEEKFESEGGDKELKLKILHNIHAENLRVMNNDVDEKFGGDDGSKENSELV